MLVTMVWLSPSEFARQSGASSAVDYAQAQPLAMSDPKTTRRHPTISQGWKEIPG